MKSKIINFLKLAFGLLILFLLFYKAGFNGIYSSLSAMKIIYLPIVLLFVFITLILGNLNLKILFDGIKHIIGFWKLFRYYMLSWAVGSFVPGKIGEYSIVYFLRKEKITIGESSAVSTIDKLSTVFSLVLISIVGFFIFFPRTDAIKMMVILVVGFIILVFILVSERIRKLIRKYVLRKYAPKFEGFSKTFFYLLKRKKRLVFLNFLLTLVKWFAQSATIYYLLLAFGSNVNIFYIMVVQAVFTIVALIPISISGLGVRESVGMALFVKLGAGITAVASMQIALLIITYSLAFLTIMFSRVKREGLKV